ncbi:MAG: MgtC/SapB family protein [Candidatus Binatia bacterium]
MLDQIPSWPYLPTLARLGLALAIGLFVGIERERRHKEAGLRTFAFAALLGAVGGLLGESFSLLALGLVGLLVVFLNVETIRTAEGAEITTSAALFITAFAGLLAGQGHTFTPSALGIATAALLAWKEPLAGFSHALTDSELRSAILLAMLAFVAYPILPPGSIDPWGLVEPRAAWITVLLIATLGFTNYILLKLYGERGIEFTGFLGGLVNSTITVAELTQRAGAAAGQLTDVTFRGVILATAAMLIRNAIILGLLAPLVLLSAAVPLTLMIAGAAIVVLWQRRLLQSVLSDTAPESNTEANQPAPTLPTLESPFSLTAAFKFGFIFLALRIAGTLAERGLGEAGFYAVSVVGGVVSSASAVASAANLATAGTLPPQVAGIGAIIASAMSALINLPLVARLGQDRALTLRIARVLGGIALLGAIGCLIQTL